MDPASAHVARLAPYVEPHLARRRTQVKHPVHDFLFTYYAYRPAQLMRWTPPGGPGALSEARRPLAEATLRLLRATAGRAGHFGCFGLHEWAMVYRDPETRHPQPLRLGATGTDRVVESHRLSCSHWDAVRFFTPPALPRNALHPASDDRPEFEQPGCLHATMDLYKVGYRLLPLVPSELVMDAFELAWDIRVLDMRAAPYDFTGLRMDHTGDEWSPVPVETPEGKQAYVAAQKRFAERGAPIRERLIHACDQILLVA